MSPVITYVVGRYPAASETFIAREVAALRRRGWTLEVVPLYDADTSGRPAAGDAAPPASGRLAVAAVRHALPLMLRLPRLPWQLLRHLPQLAALIRQVRAGGAMGIHAHFAHLPADIALLAARATGVRFTCSVHAWDVFAQPAAALRRRLQPAAGVCACSHAAAEKLLDAGLSAERVHLIHHGLPLADYRFNPAPRPGRQILAVGRLETKKGFDLLLAACARLPPHSYTCRIIGEGSQRRSLEQLAATLGVQEHVTLTGSAAPEATRQAMEAAALLVLPSRRLPDGDRDGIANVLLEAMALGTPVLTTPAGAAAEIIHDGRNARLVPPDAPEALAAAIQAELDTSPDARAGRIRAARATIEAEFDEEQTIPRLEAVLRPGASLP
jgi:glycosyltransferase involved in cell wall biosynthesis